MDGKGLIFDRMRRYVQKEVTAHHKRANPHYNVSVVTEHLMDRLLDPCRISNEVLKTFPPDGAAASLHCATLSRHAT